MADTTKKSFLYTGLRIADRKMKLQMVLDEAGVEVFTGDDVWSFRAKQHDKSGRTYFVYIDMMFDEDGILTEGEPEEMWTPKVYGRAEEADLIARLIAGR